MEKLIPNTTQIPNIILDCVLPQIPIAEGKCLMYVCRRTFGFHKAYDQISYSQFVNGIVSKDGKRLDYGTGLNRSAVSLALKNLINVGALKVISNSKGNIYEINLEMDCPEIVKKINKLRQPARNNTKQWRNSCQVVHTNNQSIHHTASSPYTIPQVVVCMDTQRIRETKRNKEDNTAATAATRLDFQKLVDYFFELKGWANKEKNFYKQERIVYARYIRPAKELMSLCEGNLDEAKICLKKVSDWAQSRDLDWSIETIFKKWYDIDKLKPKEKKPYYRGNRVFEICGRKYVLMPNGEKLEFAGSEKEITFK